MLSIYSCYYLVIVSMHGALGYFRLQFSSMLMTNMIRGQYYQFVVLFLVCSGTIADLLYVKSAKKAEYP